MGSREKKTHRDGIAEAKFFQNVLTLRDAISRVTIIILVVIRSSSFSVFRSNAILKSPIPGGDARSCHQKKREDKRGIKKGREKERRISFGEEKRKERNKRGIF